MHPHLETLLEMQDLRTQRSELRDQPSRQVEEEVFKMSVDEVLRQLEEKLREMEESLEPSVRTRFQRLAGTRERFIVPVINGTCFGCFVSIPISISSSGERNQELRVCDHCGRFLYILG